ncbi:MAG TPA: hypothetical protein VMT89_16915 [Candidatus Acidoferrales bacterium]|nr:hypothetical protein [Candidatus Acidoferrales bacterium]
MISARSWPGALLSIVTVLLAVVPASAVEVCRGDCNADGAVTIDELIRGTDITLGAVGYSTCSVFDADGDHSITVDELIAAANFALDGCPSSLSPIWYPAVTYASIAPPNTRGYLDRRGLIHAHSYYSHDACDNMPVKNGVRDPVCFEDFRRGLCQSRHDFVMLTDHSAAFSQYEYPDVLLYRPDHGDQLVERGGRPVASWAGCPDGTRALIMAGTETAFMPVGMEEHVDGDPTQRDSVYSSLTVDGIEAERATGAVVLTSHTENWTLAQLRDWPVDGFEMYNIHANLLRTPQLAVQLLFRLAQNDRGLPHPDLVLLDLISEDPRYLSMWGSVLASGVHRVTTVGTDCHRNTFPTLMGDGERVDSYRRLMIWFSNHLLVRPDSDGSWDDRHLKEALLAGRLYAAFEVLGYPDGFDYHAEAGDQIVEMGGEVQFADHPLLRVTPPQVRNLNPMRTAPTLTVRILRAMDGGFTEVAAGPSSLSFTPTESGSYRAEVRMVPNHLREDLGSDADKLLAKDFVWIYANAIYVR